MKSEWEIDEREHMPSWSLNLATLLILSQASLKSITYNNEFEAHLETETSLERGAGKGIEQLQIFLLSTTM